MSLITDNPEDSPRHCAAKHNHRRRRLLIAASSAATSLIALAIILSLTLRPSAPRFTLLAATASIDDYSNATTTGGIARVRFDAAFMAHNPNARAAALYDRLQARASYGAGVQLAARPLPPFEQAQGDAVLTTSLASSSSAAPGTGVATETEASEGGRPTTTLLRVRVEGQLRWKVASWVSGRHALAAECVAVVVLQSSRAVVVQGSQCATTLQ